MTPPLVAEARAFAADWSKGPGEARELIERLADELERVERVLADPMAVHVNMLRGSIAKPSAAAIRHVYGKELDLK
jgi:hypothetical protein